MRAKIKNIEVREKHFRDSPEVPLTEPPEPQRSIILKLTAGFVDVPLTPYGVNLLFNSIWLRVPERFADSWELDLEDLIGKHVTYQRNEDNKIVLVARS